MLLTFKFCFYVISESQKKKVASSSQKTFDVISSAVRSALGIHGKESVTVEVNPSVFCSFAQDGTERYP